MNNPKSAIWHPFDVFTQETIKINSAKGAWLYADNDRNYLDGISSWWVNLHGHAHPAIAHAISKQALELEHVIFAGFTHQPAELLSQNLLEILPSNQEKIFFSDNGSTAVEVALKMAIQYHYNLKTDKNIIVALEGAYHGDTFGAMSTGDRNVFNAPFNQFLFDVIHLPFPSSEEIVLKFEEICKSNKVALFIYEPLVQGAAGMKMYSPAILQALLEIAKKYDVITIADEVMTGFGRTGTYFASLQSSILPDIMCLSKGITGGFMPLGITSCAKFIYDVFDSQPIDRLFLHGHSYTGNPLACAAANASYELLSSEECQNAIQEIVHSHKNFLTQLRTYSTVSNCRQCGTIVAFDIQTKELTQYTNSFRDVIYEFFLSQNVLLRPMGNTIYILPPYCITQDELNLLYKACFDLIEYINQ